MKMYLAAYGSGNWFLKEVVENYFEYNKSFKLKRLV